MLSNKRSHIIEENTNSPMFSCGFCPKLLKSQKKLKSHERIHTEEKQYPCGYCNKMFKNVKNHEKRIHKDEIEKDGDVEKT